MLSLTKIETKYLPNLVLDTVSELGVPVNERDHFIFSGCFILESVNACLFLSHLKLLLM